MLFTCGSKSDVGASQAAQTAGPHTQEATQRAAPRAGEASTSAPTAAPPEQAKPRKFRSSWDAKEASAEADSKVDYLAELGRAEYNINVTHGAFSPRPLACSLALPLDNI